MNSDEWYENGPCLVLQHLYLVYPLWVNLALGQKTPTPVAKVIVTGGAGYIGSHTVLELIEAGHDVVSIDNYFNCYPEQWQALEELAGRSIPQYEIDLEDPEATDEVFAMHSDAEAVIHFAARIYVGESVEKPLRYFRQNLGSLLNVLESMQRHGQRAIIFSSSCSVYGNAAELPVTEKSPFGKAESPYARTKQMGEHILEDFVRANPGIQAVILRYFNPAGAHPSAKIGEAPKLEQTHLVPLIMEVAAGHRKELKVFGSDFPTRDGTCIRDFIHVSDLGSAHERAVSWALRQNGKPGSNPGVFNLGAGEGVSILEAIQAFEAATGMQLPHTLGPRRDGDVAAIYASSQLAHSELGWQPRFSLEDIMRHAWAWEQARQHLPIHG